MVPGDLAVLDDNSGEVRLRPFRADRERPLRHGEAVIVLQRWQRGAEYTPDTDAWEGDVEILTPWGTRGWVLESRLKAV